MAGVQINAIEIEEGSVGNEEHIHVDRHQHRDEKERGTPHELICPFIRDDGKGRRIKKDMMVFMLKYSRCCTDLKLLFKRSFEGEPVSRT